MSERPSLEVYCAMAHADRTDTPADPRVAHPPRETA